MYFTKLPLFVRCEHEARAALHPKPLTDHPLLTFYEASSTTTNAVLSFHLDGIFASNHDSFGAAAAAAAKP